MSKYASYFWGKWPVDPRTKVEMLRFQQLHQDLLPLQIPKWKPSKVTLLDLPIEIIQEIASFLPLPSKAAFTLTCSTLMGVVGTQSWRDLARRTNIYERHDFGRLLERDLANGIYCYGCKKMHYTSLRLPTIIPYYYSIPQLRMKIRWLSNDRGREALLYVFTLMQRSGISCEHICRLSTWEFWGSHSQHMWGSGDHSLLQDSWGWVVMPPGGPSPDDGLRVFPIASDSEAPDTTHVFQIELGATRGTALPVLPPSRLVELGPSMYAHQLTSGAESQDPPLSACSIIISGPQPNERGVKKHAGVRYFVRRLFRRRCRESLRLDSYERHIRSLRNSRRIQDRTMDMRMFRDEMWDRDRHVWAIEQQRKRAGRRFASSSSG